MPILDVLSGMRWITVRLKPNIFLDTTCKLSLKMRVSLKSNNYKADILNPFFSLLYNRRRAKCKSHFLNFYAFISTNSFDLYKIATKTINRQFEISRHR